MRAKSKGLLYIGLMSGTSLDGIDAALVEISKERLLIRTIEAFKRPFEPKVRAELLALVSGVGGIDQLTRAHVALGILYAEAVEKLLRLSGLKPVEITAIGCHGQTIRHFPEAADSLGRRVTATLQIGDAATLAERSGITVINNFRARDMAAGGQGAPLVPLLDYLLFTDAAVGRVALNIGGIANVTLLPPGVRWEEVTAFDTGPGNVLLDIWARRISCGTLCFDPNGEMAARGHPVPAILAELMSHPYFQKNPPKSTGREEFGEQILMKFADCTCNQFDIMATLAHFTAGTIAEAITRYWPAERPPSELIASGGGVHNKTLMKLLAEELKGIPIRLSDQYGIHSDFKEAIAFAVLADLSLRGRPGNLPGATGARRQVVLGQLTP
jgi:anhydro-N-acetylmuramic acid kinase